MSWIEDYKLLKLYFEKLDKYSSEPPKLYLNQNKEKGIEKKVISN